MNTRIAQGADRIIEAGWLLVVVVTPLYFNVYSTRGFESDKVAVLRSLVMVMTAAWLVRTIEAHAPGAELPPAGPGRRDTPRLLWETVRTTPLVLPALVFVLAYGAATLSSTVPRLSILGSYQRLQGAYTTLSYLVLFGLLLQGIRHRGQVERLITVIILSSLPVALYGILQQLQSNLPAAALTTGAADPLATSYRVTSTLGNALFVAGYLIMVVPLTMARLRDVVSRSGRPVDHTRSDTAAGAWRWLSMLAYGVILASQVTATALTQTRGAWIGLLAGLFFWLVLWAVDVNRPRFVMAAFGVVLVYLVLLAVVSVPRSPLAPLRNLPYVGRLTRIFSREDTSQVRVLIWRGAARLVRHDPLRSLIGYGPETMQTVYLPFYPSALAAWEGSNVLPDRAHNETWDILITTGALGFAAYVWLMTAVLYRGLQGLGCLHSASARRMFVICWFGGGAMVPALLTHLLEPGFFGIGVVLGLLLGLSLFLAWCALTRRGPDAGPGINPDVNWILPLLAALIAHFVETQLDLAVVVTHTYFWVYCALLAVSPRWSLPVGDLVAELPSREPPSVEPPTVTAAARTKQRRGSIGAAHTARERGAAHKPSIVAERADGLLAGSVVLGVMLVLMVYDFYRPRDPASDRSWLWLTAVVWIVATLVILSGAPCARVATGWLHRLGLHSGVSLLPALCYSLLHRLMLARTEDAGVLWAWLVWLACLGLGWIALALVLSREESSARRRAAGLVALGYPLIAMVAVLLISVLNVRLVTADMLHQLGDERRQKKDYRAALSYYAQALSLQPSQDFYWHSEARAWYVLAQETRDHTIREARFQAAQQALQQARSLNPDDPVYALNLARLHMTWAALASGRQERALHRRQALSCYATAQGLNPHDPNIAGERAVALKPVR